MRTITVSATTYFHVAASELGDATQWLRIARLNGDSDPEISGIREILVPDPDPAASGGIAEQ